MKFEDLKFETVDDMCRVATFVIEKDGSNEKVNVSAIPEWRGEDENGKPYYFEKDDKKHIFGIFPQSAEGKYLRYWRGVDISTSHDWKDVEECLTKMENWVEPKKREFTVIYGCKDFDEDWDDNNADYEYKVTLLESRIQKVIAKGKSEIDAIIDILEDEIEEDHGTKDGVQLIERHEHENLDQYPDEDWENETALVAFKEIGGSELVWKNKDFEDYLGYYRIDDGESDKEDND
jgi:hypothetical protein